MGMFDELYCKYPLPTPDFQDRLFQTKSFDECNDLYEIREDGTLWRESPRIAWIEDRTHPHGGILQSGEKEWKRCVHSGEVRFYDVVGENTDTHRCGWIEFVAFFINGNLKAVHLVQNRPIEPKTPA